MVVFTLSIYARRPIAFEREVRVVNNRAGQVVSCCAPCSPAIFPHVLFSKGVFFSQTRVLCVGRLSYVLFVGFLLFNTLFQNFAWISPEFYRKFTRNQRISPELNQTFTRISNRSTYKKGITTTRPSHSTMCLFYGQLWKAQSGKMRPAVKSRQRTAEEPGHVSYIISSTIISYHIVSYHIMSFHII